MSITSFRGDYFFLSNFYPVPKWNGKTLEHYYQSAKTLDEQWSRAIINCNTPGQSKRKGRQAPMRPDWEQVKDKVMFSLLTSKFEDTNLRSMLLKTDPQVIEEHNSWGDTYWGICGGKGKNTLGRMLMNLRFNIIIEKEWPDLLISPEVE